MPIKNLRRVPLLLLAFALLFSACALQTASLSPLVPATPIVSSSIQINTFTPPPKTISNNDAIPAALREQMKNLNLPVNAGVHINILAKKKQTATQVPWVYALVAPFPTVTDGVTFDELNLAWTQGTAPAAFSGHPLLMDEPTLAAFKALWGEPAGSLVRTVASDGLLDTAWSDLG